MDVSLPVSESLKAVSHGFTSTSCTRDEIMQFLRSCELRNTPVPVLQLLQRRVNTPGTIL
jgi:hypothetical protein